MPNSPRRASTCELVLAHAGATLPKRDPVDVRIIEQVRTRTEGIAPLPRHHTAGLFETAGRRAHALSDVARGHLSFLGASVVGIGASLLNPRRIRMRELSAQFEQVCINAIPVVALVTLLIGVVVTYLLGLQAKQYGANIFVVDGVGIGATREFAPIIVAIIVAGRSGAAFTAQLGSMRLTEETDAIRTLGLAPLDVLVLPRVIALMIAMPLLVFVGDVDQLPSVGPGMVLKNLAENTGGVASLTRYPAEAIASIDDFTRFEYLLGYYPTNHVLLGEDAAPGAPACRFLSLEDLVHEHRLHTQGKADGLLACCVFRTELSGQRERRRGESAGQEIPAAEPARATASGAGTGNLLRHRYGSPFEV